MSSSHVGNTSDEKDVGKAFFNFRVPHLNTTGAYDSSNTEERMLPCFYGIVKFEEWKEFDKLMTDTIEATSHIPFSNRQQAQDEMRSCFRKVNKVYPNAEQNSLYPTKSRHPGPKEMCYSVTPLYEHYDVRKHYDNCTSVVVMENIFSAVLELLEGIYSELYNFEFTTKKFSLLGIPRFLGGKAPTSDKSLCSVTMNRCDVPPICTFELKGPTVPFAKYVREFCEGDSSNAKSKNEAHRCVHEVSSKWICSYLNYLFDVLRLRNDGSTTSSPNTSIGVAKRVAQSLVQALTTSSGCGFLFNYETGLAFEITGDNESGEMVVRTSSLFCCGNQRGAVSALLTTANYAVKKLSQDKLSSERVRKCAKMLADNCNRRTSKDSNDNRKLSSRKGNEGSHSKQSSRENPNEKHGKKKQLPSDQWVSARGNLNMASKKSFEKSDTCHSSIESDSDMSDITQESAAEETERMLTEIFSAQRQVIGSGGSGIVLSSEWSGVKVALKIWNGEEESGLLELRKEVQTYKYFELHAPSLLGAAVPKSRLALDTSEKDGPLNATVALVIDYIGDEISRDVEGNLWLGSYPTCKLSLTDERGIHIAALRSLRLLHDKEVLHGDICLHHLRVEADQTEGERIRLWRAWWIDFGRASVGLASQWKRNAEEEMCNSLFKTKPCSTQPQTMFH